MTWNLFIDDERWPTDVNWAEWYGVRENWVIARNWPEAYDVIKKLGFPNFISFDHDLGDPDVEPTGFEIAKMLVEFDMDNILEIPSDFSFYVHSQNIIGAENIRKLLDNYLKFKRSQ